MRRELVGLVVLAATLWSVWLLAGLQRAMSQEAGSPQQRKLVDADRIVHYRFDRDGGPVFHLDGNETELRLVTHLVLEPGREYAADRTYDYGLRLRIEGPDGSTLWQRDIHTSTRQSKAEWEDGMWMRENAFGLEPGTEVTDDRAHLVTLPRSLPWGSRFHVRLQAPAASYGLLRAYERAKDSSIGLAMAYFGPAQDEAQRLVGNLTYLPWEVLTEEQRTMRLELRWNRLSALGELGTDYEVDTIFYSGFRAPPAELPPPPPVTLVDDRATALTAFGPGVLTVWIHADCSALGPDAPEPSVQVVHVEATGLGGARHVDPCTDPSFATWLPEGPHTLHVRGQDLPPTTVEAWYDDHRQETPDLPGLELGRPLRPTITRSPRVRLFTGSAPAEYALVEPEDLESAMLELRAQLPVPTGSTAAAQRPASLRYAFTDRHGQVLEEGRWLVEPAEQLERYELVVDASNPEQQWWLGTYRVARIIAPEGTRHLRLEADGDVIASIYTYWRGMLETPTPQPPYDEHMLVGTRWRRVPHDHRRWFLVEPGNAHVLQHHGQTVDIHGPIRLELVGDEAYTSDDGEAEIDPTLEPGVDPTLEPGVDPALAGPGTASESPWVSLLPYTKQEQRTVLERTPPESPWARYVRWRPGRATLAADDDWGATLVYLVDGDPALALGKDIEVTIDGQVLRTTIVSTRDAWSLPGLHRGTHALELGALPEGVRVYLDRPRLRPEQGPAETYRVVTIHRLGRKRMGLWIDKTADARDYVNALAYRCSEHEPSRLRVELDRGSPERQRGVVVDGVTRAVRERTLPARGEPAELVFLDRPQAPCEALGRVPIPLGPDVSRGRHRVELYVEDGPGLWVRFFRRGTAGAEDARAREWTERVLDLPARGRAP